MNIGNGVAASSPVATMNAQESHNPSSVEQKIEQLKKQIQQIKQDQKLSQEEKDKRIANLENKVVQLERQKGQERSQTSSAERKKRFDTYETYPQPPQAGLYQVSHDDKGHRIIQTEQHMDVTQAQSNAGPGVESQKTDHERETPILVKTTGNTDKVDREIEQLKQTQRQLEQQLAAAKEPKEKESLEIQLAQVQAELNLKDNDTYRRQHMEITEQTVVSKVGE